MRLETPFIHMPLRFDVNRLRSEVEAFAPDEWSPHPHGFVGNDAMLLVTVGGGVNHETIGPMAPTPMLARSPYLRQVMASFDTVIGRSRLMRLEGGANVTEHADTNYYWHDHVRVHVPIITNPSVEFLCGGHTIHMPPGESFIFDTWRLHDVINHTRAARVHLVFDTVGSAKFWELAAQGAEPHKPSDEQNKPEPRLILFDGQADPSLRFERHNAQVVMAPGEVDLLCRELSEQVNRDGPIGQEQSRQFVAVLDQHRHRWRATFASYGQNADGFEQYAQLLGQLVSELTPLQELTLRTNSMQAASVAQAWLITPALNTQLSGASPSKPAITDRSARPPSAPVGANMADTIGRTKPVRVLDRPIFIVAAPRSGSTLLFETLAKSDDLHSLGGEAHGVFESIPALYPASRNFDSNRLTADDASPAVARQIRLQLVKGALNNKGQHFWQTPPAQRPSQIRFLEKTPKNALRIGFLATLFPDALFIHLTRDPRANIGSIMDAWRSRRFVTYANLPEAMNLVDCDTPGWSLLLPEGWRDYRGKRLVEVAALQWASANRAILVDLINVSPDRVCRIRYESFVEDPATETERLCKFINVPYTGGVKAAASSPLPHSRYTLSAPSKDKWRRHEQEILEALPSVAVVVEQLACADAPV